MLKNFCCPWSMPFTRKWISPNVDHQWLENYMSVSPTCWQCLHVVNPNSPLIFIDQSSISIAARSANDAWNNYRSQYANSPLIDMFVGQLSSTITCGHCGHKSMTWDPFWDLSLPLPSRRYGSVTTMQCLEDFLSHEELDRDEQPVSFDWHLTSDSLF